MRFFWVNFSLKNYHEKYLFLNGWNLTQCNLKTMRKSRLFLNLFVNSNGFILQWKLKSDDAPSDLVILVVIQQFSEPELNMATNASNNHKFLFINSCWWIQEEIAMEWEWNVIRSNFNNCLVEKRHEETQFFSASLFLFSFITISHHQSKTNLMLRAFS